MKIKRLLLSIIFLAMFTVWSVGRVEAAIINVVEDASTYSYWTAGGFGPSVSTATSTSIILSNPGGQSYYWTKFDLSQIPASAQINSATFNMYATYAVDTAGVNYKIGSYYVANDSWKEPLFFNDPQGITWDTQPTIMTQPTDSVHVTSYPYWYQWDVTQSVRSALNDDKTLTLVFRFTEDTYPPGLPGNMSGAGVGLSENTSFLNVQVAPVPIPAAFWLLGTGLVGLIGIRRRFTR